MRQEKSAIPTSIGQKQGAVTFLDVLGWKGIWQRNDSAINTLYSLIIETKKMAKTISLEYSDITEFRGKDEITKVLSISDTIALFTDSSSSVAIQIQAKICAWLLPYALEQGLPLRGAISFGEYSVMDNIMLGYAVDEAASWHESTDWIGVVLSPSALIKCAGDICSPLTIFTNIPFKRHEKNMTICVNWEFDDKDKLAKIIETKGPLTPEIAAKYMNTLAFLDRNKQNKKRLRIPGRT